MICFIALVSFTYSRCTPIRVNGVMANGIRHQQKLKKFVEKFNYSVSVSINCWYQDKICSYNKSDVLEVKICVSFSFQYTFIAQFGGRHEDLSHPENSCRPRAKPDGDMNFLDWTNLHVSRLTGQFNCLLYIPKAEVRPYTSQSVVTGRHDVWSESRRFVFPPCDVSRPIILLYSSYQLYKV